MRLSALAGVVFLLSAICLATVAGAPGASAMPYRTWVYATAGGLIDPPGTDPGTPETEPPDETPSDPAVPEDAAEGYYVHVSLEEQLVRVYLDGEKVRQMICSGGTPDMPTPVGRFYLQNRGESFFSQKYQQGAWWWVSFRDWGIYLFHSVPFGPDGKVIEAEAEKLGRPASHGCIRLSLEDAQWFYESVPQNAPVDIE